jgi:hypothetical protein
MIWSHFDTAWEEGLDAAAAWAAEHGHLAAPIDAAGAGGYPVGKWLANQRAAAKRADEVERRRQQGLPMGSMAGVLTDERRQALEEIDPAWCPTWPVSWQRSFHHTRLHLEAGGELPTKPGTVIVQGDDLGRWVQQQRLGFDKLSTAQQWMLHHTLGATPPHNDEVPQPRRSHAEKWALSLAAARQYRAREGHLNVPRTHTETIIGDDGQEQHIRLGAWISNQRTRASRLTPEQTAQLTELGMRWKQNNQPRATRKERQQKT